MSAINERLQAIRDRIAEAARDAGRMPESVTLLAVSKTHAPELLREVYAAGQTAFGESYLQEALDKMAALADLPLEWHFIGPIQSNKTRQIAEHFSWVHGVDRLKIAQRLSDARPPHLPPLNVCIQVNVSNEASKSGCSPDEAAELARAISARPNLKLRGLMTIPQPTEDVELQHKQFSTLRELFETLRQNEMPLDTLSMGMSHDFPVAVAEGATIVRVGTALFGARLRNA